MRGVIVNETDLAGVLCAGKIDKARINALTHKLLDDDRPLLADNLPVLVVSPHDTRGSVDSRQRLAGEVAVLIRDYKRGAPRNSSLPA